MKTIDPKPSSDEEEHHKPPPPSAHAVASCEDLLREILSRLRPKTLARFKTVSKRWNSLISDPDLLRNRPPRPADGLVFPALRIIPFFVAPFDDPNIDRKFMKFSCNQPFESIAFVHGCNGLLLCSGKDKKDLSTKYFVINPTTLKYSRLPKRRNAVDNESTEMLGMCLAFDPSESLGYKVICVSGSKRDTMSILYKRFEVYSSKTGSWRSKTMETPFVGNLDIENGVYWNGRVHWITKHGHLDSIYFNPDDDDDRFMHRVFPLPPSLDWSCITQARYLTYFGESGGHLHLVIHNQMNGSLFVYEMRRDYSEWFVKYKSRINIRSCGKVQGRDSLPDRIRALVRGKKEEDIFLIYRVMEKATLQYNIVRHTYEISHDNSCLYPWKHQGLPLPYIESISPV